MKLLKRATIMILLFCLIDEFFFMSAHGAHGFEAIKGIHIVIGIAAGSVVMLVAKNFGKYFLYRKPDYYQGDETRSVK